MIHASGDFSVKNSVSFSPEACEIAINALKSGSHILTDTFMAKAAISPMAKRTLNSEIRCILEWAPEIIEGNLTSVTRSSLAMKNAWFQLMEMEKCLSRPIVVIGSAPTALIELINMIDNGSEKPSLIIGMPVGFIGVSESKTRLAKSGIPHIILQGSKGGASLSAAVINALLRCAESEL